MTEQNNTTKDKIFYSQKSISLASFLGGPMAAGYLIKENYKALNQQEEGKKAFIISIIATITIFVGLFILPESIVNKIPKMIIPVAYTGIIYLIVDKIHGVILNKHQENENTFYSGWRAAGISVISLLILTITIFAAVFLIPDKVYDAYDAELVQFTKNEEESLLFYDHINSEDSSSLITELNESVIPKWKENIEIINRTNTIESLPVELLEQNKLLLQYSELRLEAFELFKKAVLYDSNKYDEDLNRVHNEIEIVLGKLN